MNEFLNKYKDFLSMFNKGKTIVELHGSKLYIDDSIKNYSKAFVVKLSLIN